MKNFNKNNKHISSRQIFSSLIIAILSIFIVIVALGSLSGGVKQPIVFNHKIHAENGLECLDCHQLFEKYASSGRPSLETCSTCHEEPLGEGKEEAKLIEYVKSGKEIVWQRLYRVPEDVFFSHRRHVAIAGIECQVCHGSIGESSQPPSKPLKITMEKCMKCHNEKKADNDCIACHR